MDALTYERGNYADLETENTYYYGLFNPADSVNQYCYGGCVLGLSNLPFGINDPSLRSSIGLGFPEVAAYTLAHEVGHAHGRLHTPGACGAVGTDPDYPYSQGSIGTWGYDILTGLLYDPDFYTNVMGYCEEQWISDYTFGGIYDRVEALAQLDRSAPREISRLRVDMHGETHVRGTTTVYGPTVGHPPISVDLYDETGAWQRQVIGWWSPNSHLPGGLVQLDEVIPEGWTAQALESPTL